MNDSKVGGERPMRCTPCGNFGGTRRFCTMHWSQSLRYCCFSRTEDHSARIRPTRGLSTEYGGDPD
eukprot:scaffold149_cov315-Pinguiococcus_pyrenoidosus.AAC.19